MVKKITRISLSFLLKNLFFFPILAFATPEDDQNLIEVIKEGNLTLAHKMILARPHETEFEEFINYLLMQFINNLQKGIIDVRQ